MRPLRPSYPKLLSTHTRVAHAQYRKQLLKSGLEVNIQERQGSTSNGGHPDKYGRTWRQVVTTTYWKLLVTSQSGYSARHGYDRDSPRCADFGCVAVCRSHVGNRSQGPIHQSESCTAEEELTRCKQPAGLCLGPGARIWLRCRQLRFGSFRQRLHHPSRAHRKVVVYVR